MNKEYKYNAIFTIEDDGISIGFPDLPGALSCADNIEEAMQNAKEILWLDITYRLKNGDKIPVNGENKFNLGKNDKVFEITIKLDEFKEA